MGRKHSRRGKEMRKREGEEGKAREREMKGKQKRGIRREIKREGEEEKSRERETERKSREGKDRSTERKKKRSCNWNCSASQTMANVFNCLLSPARFVIIKVVFMGDLGRIKNTLAPRSHAEMDVKASEQTNPHRSCNTGCFVDALLL